jgi:hypothetical protein
MNSSIHDYYAQANALTALDASLIRPLPDDVAQLTAIVQGVLLHWFVAQTMYGVSVAPEREAEAHLRFARQIVDGILRLDERDLQHARAPEKRLVGVCHHFAKLLVALLRGKKIPARMRYGFGDYFHAGFCEDHSLVEYWNAAEKRWGLVDPQFDAVWQQHIKHQPLDVPRTHFLVPATAWQRCRAGEADAATFGTINGDLHGLWFIAGNLVKDLAALNKTEMLQWDVWDGMPRPGDPMQDKKALAFFDRLADLLREPDVNFEALRKFYADADNNVAVPERVFNAMRQRPETWQI